MQYAETRSARAIAIDRSRTARQVYGNFNQKYAGSPNRSDVKNYDTKHNSGKINLPKNNFVEKKDVKKINGEYVPTELEKAELLPYFYQLNPIEQHKDLLVTKNVIKRKSDVDKWKKTPKYYDVRGIDTQPKELVEERIKVVHKHVGNILIVPEGGNYRIRGRDTRDALAVYSHHPMNYKDLGKIIIRPKKIMKKSNSYYNYNTIIAHELGHAYDRNYLKGVTIGYDVWKGVPKSIEKKNYGFGKTNNLMVELGRKSYKEVWKPVEKVTRTRLFPYSMEDKKVFDNKGNLIGVQRVRKGYHEYRQKKEELFANWFSGFINQKNVVKKRSRHFYNVFKKQNKPLFKNLRMLDFNVTKKYIGGKNARSWNFF